MKKLIITFLTIALLLFAVPVLAVGYHSTGLTSIDSRCSFVDGDSWLWWDGLDFSDYASGNWEIILTDSSGNRARGIAGAVGTGEALGSELLTNPSFDVDVSGWTAVDSTLASVAGGYSNNCCEVTRTGGTYQQVNSSTLSGFSSGALYYTSLYIKSGSTGANVYRFKLTIGFGEIALEGTSSSVWTRDSAYLNGLSTVGSFWFRSYNSIAGTMLFDEASVKQITEPATTGIHILKGPNSTEGWAEIDSGFDYNAVTEIEIIPLATVEGCTLTGTKTE